MVSLIARKLLGLLLSAAMLIGLLTTAALAAGGSVTHTLLNDGPVPCGGLVAVTLNVTGQNPPPEDQTVDMMLVLDRSGSMSSAAMAALKSASNSFVDQMDGRDGALDGTISPSRVGLVSFSSTATLNQALSHSSPLLKSKINALSPGGTTALGDGVQLAHNHLVSNSTNKQVIIMMTDGQTNTGVNPLTAANNAKAAGIEIFAIGLGNSLNETQLKAMATSPAHYYKAPTTAQLQQIFDTIATEIQQPAATGLSYTVQSGADFDLVSASADKGTVSSAGDGFVWNLNQLGSEMATISYVLQHNGSLNGLKAMHALADLTWTDDNGVAQGYSYAGATVEVIGCNLPPVADAGPDQTVPQDASGFGAVILDGSGSTDDGQINPLTYDWYLGATHLGSGQTLGVNLPLGDSMIHVVVDDGEFADSDTVLITVVDVIAPETTATLSGVAGDNGWYVNEVTVNLSAMDNLLGSGVANTEFSLNGDAWQSYTGPVTVPDDGIHVIEYRSTDHAGNVEATKSAGFMIDATAPDIQITSPTASVYTGSETLTISFSASDAGSGLSQVTADLDGDGVADLAVVDLWTLPLGSHTLTVHALDNAGNTSVSSVTFEIEVTHDSLEALKHILADMGLITNHGIVTSLDQKIRAAKAADQRGQDTPHDKIMRAFIAEVEAQRGVHIDSGAADLLIIQAQWLIDHT